MDLNLSLRPGDVCFYTVRAECGLPSFQPMVDNTTSVMDGVDIFSIEFDDSDISPGF